MESSKTEMSNVYNIVIQDVIKNIKDVFKDENISLYVLRDLETLWTTKFLKTREPTLPVNLVPMKITAPFKNSPLTEIIEIREIELMVPHQEGELLDFNTIFSEGVMNSVIYMTNREATMFLQQRINTYLANKDQVENMIPTTENEEETKGDFLNIVHGETGEFLNVSVKTEPTEDENLITIKEEPLDVVVKEEPIYGDAFPELDGTNDSSDDSSEDTKSNSSHKSEVDQSIYGSDGETLNSDDDVTDEDIDTLFDSDNLILCQYMKVMRSKNKWRFYFKDGVMNLNGCDYAFHKIFGDASW